MRRLWEEHVRHEFATHNTEETLATMVEDAYVNHIPVLTGGFGLDQLREFYSRRFIPQMPPDTEMAQVSRTVGENQLVDEMVFKFTHSIRMDWMLPGVAPTGKRVEVPLVAIVRSFAPPPGRASSRSRPMKAACEWSGMMCKSSLPL